MKKDIEIPIAKEVNVVLVHEWNDEFLAKEWNAYIINNRTSTIEMVLIVSKGFDEDRETSTMRHSINSLPEKSFKKIELVQEEVLALNNEFFVTFFADEKLFEKRFLFLKNTVTEKHLQHIPIIDREGVIAQ
ncbi:hypothetical protein JQC67_02335 [Aurantibacter crassamenti]|uniref:hypothetical protein n=1 Tax=Aurantibacter crassamenti TaxID=1837375 RepID=UPI00193AB438|nr:hypothetical protein [Aurantibacter crassamenti]MBM1104967.1 hypothetical protein [Aurantibacter crassamenti]